MARLLFLTLVIIIPFISGAQNSLLQFNDQLVQIVEDATPSVVTIKTEKTLKIRQSDMFGGGFWDSWFGTPQEYDQSQKGMGSGVIFSPEGFIVTNNHVISGADKILVKIVNGSEIEAKLIGSDPRTDVAVLKINPFSGMKPLKIGNSDMLRVGELVLAIGSPLEEQLSQTVTMGIVSAKGRSNMGLADFEDFIQTDAAINPGNSGGALINVKGELVGINTAIMSRSGGNQGIGFAIPVTMAKNAMESLIQFGKVVRGYSGIFVSGMREEQIKAASVSGKAAILVTEVDPQGPGVLAGIQPGDIILKLNGLDINDAVQFRSRIATMSPGNKVEIEFSRKGKIALTNLILKEVPVPGEGKSSLSSSKYFLGFSAELLTPALQNKYRIPDYDGLIVTEVVPDSKAAKGGLNPGDVLLSVDNRAVKNQEELMDSIKGKNEGEVIRLKIWRGGRYYFVNVELG